ncbi:dentin sialophosphoprotein [Salix suchowensis]|nr:dentin sialophosphoprotein [Salix suchowensis]
MGSSSKDLLHLENKYFSTPSSLESILRVCDKDSGPKKRPTDEKPLTNPVPQSQVLGKVRDFLGVISEANKRLQADAKENSEEYDIEVLTGNESEVVEMDLMLGIADLHTPEAVAAAEAAIAGGQSMISLAACSSETESEDSSDESESDDGASDDTESNGEDNADDNIKTCKSGKNDSTEGSVKQRSKKQKIVELS